jgi:hypothetical protein
MAYVWIQCETEDFARRLVVFALMGSFNGGNPMPARISPICPRTVDVNFGEHFVDMDRIRALTYVEAADYFSSAALFPDPELELQAELKRWLTAQPTDDQGP